MKKLGLYISLSLLLAVSSCNAQSLDKKVDSLISYSVDTVSSQVLHSKLKTEKNVFLLDTRSQKEFKVSHIKGAQFANYDTFKVGALKNVSKESTVVVYCTVGYRSEKIGEKLKEAGYKNVLNLYGGIFSWKNNGFEVVDNNNKETQKVHTYDKSWSKYLKKGLKVYE